jgi:hypothetical protein
MGARDIVAEVASMEQLMVALNVKGCRGRVASFNFYG